MDLGIKNRFVLITGASKGLGEALCKTFIAEGAIIIACSRNLKNLKKLKSKIDDKKSLFVTCDFTKKKKIKDLIKILKKKNMMPDIVVNNVGGDMKNKNSFTSYNNYEKIFRLNLGSSIELNNEVIPFLKKKKWGRICHVSSISAVENHGTPAYCASKSALNAYVRSLGRQLIKNNIVMSAVMPGAFITKDGYWDNVRKKNKKKFNYFKKNRIAAMRFGNVEEISNVVAFLCGKNVSFCAGSTFLVDGGQGRVFTDLR